MEISGQGDFSSHDLDLFGSRDVIRVPPAQRKPKLCQCEVARARRQSFLSGGVLLAERSDSVVKVRHAGAAVERDQQRNQRRTDQTQQYLTDAAHHRTSSTQCSNRVCGR